MNIKYEVETKKPFNEAVESLKKSVAENKFGVQWEINFKETLKDKGIDFPNNFKVLEVCNPIKANEVLTKNIEVGYFLPCKLVVYEKEQTVFVGMIRPTELLGIMGNDELMGIAKEVEDILKNIIDSSIN